jgi:hypothetical protein
MIKVTVDTDKEYFERYNRQKPAPLRPIEIDEYFCCTNTNFGGDDPAKIDDTKPVTTFDPTPDTI